MRENIYLAKSMAGHDKNHVYVVVDDRDGFLYLCNGITKPISNPKKKKKMHVMLIKHLRDEVNAVIDQIDNLNDEAVIEILNAYKQELESRTKE